ncbi:MAG: hypothetical protein ACOX2J_00875 [Bacillota bacterium]|jgi:hypothetical protein
MADGDPVRTVPVWNAVVRYGAYIIITVAVLYFLARYVIPLFY